MSEFQIADGAAETWLSGVNGTAELKLNGVNDTVESVKITFVYDRAPRLCGVIDTAESAQTLLSQFEKLVKDLSSFKEKNKSKFKQGWIILPKAFETKTLKIWLPKKTFWLSGVKDTAESTSTSNISANLKLYAKTPWGV